MGSAFWRHVFLIVAVTLLALAVRAAPQSGGDFSHNPQPAKVPAGVILIKGAWSSASDSVTPVPEAGRAANNVYTNAYFGLAYVLPQHWIEKYTGPPPSDSGYYVLAQIRPAESTGADTAGSILVAAQDLFFSLTPAVNALDLISFTKDHLQSDYTVEQSPAKLEIAGRSFIRFDYASPVADLHWRILATQIRCHAIEFIFTARDTKLAESLIQDMNRMTLPAGADLLSGAGGGDVPVCVKDYASDENVLQKVDPILTEHRFNPVPVRIIIDTNGKVKHIHFLSAFPDQAKAISDALAQWRFRPYVRDGHPVEVETGIMFGRAPRPSTPASTTAAVD
jgi:hypothetical protein